MLIPLSVERPIRRRPIVVPTLIALNTGCFVLDAAAALMAPAWHERVYPMLWVVGGEGFGPWQLWTHAFLHAGLMHLLGNMLILWVFGPSVEDRYGRFGFIALYLAGAALAGGLHAGFERAVGVPVPAVGASGAIAAVTGSFLVLFPSTWVRSLFLIGLAIGRVPAWWFIGLAIAWDLLSQSFGVERGVAHLAHLGGYIAGFTLSILLLWRRVFPREPYDLFSVFVQAKRRRDIRAAAAGVVPRPVAAARREAGRREAARREEGMPSKPRPGRRPKPGSVPADLDRADRLASARANVTGLIASGDRAAAAAAYSAMLREFDTGDGVRAVALSRDNQLIVARELFQARHDAQAARAFEAFLAAYPTDREADGVRVLLARLIALSPAAATGGAARAVELLTAVEAKSFDDGLRAMARAELARIGNAAGAGSGSGD